MSVGVTVRQGVGWCEGGTVRQTGASTIYTNYGLG